MNIQKGSSFVIAVTVLCCIALGVRAEEVAVVKSDTTAAETAFVTPEYRDEKTGTTISVDTTPVVAEAEAAPTDAEAAPVIAMEVAATATSTIPAESDMLSLSMVEIDANNEVVDFSSLSESGSLELSADEQDAIIAEALENMEIEFIRDYGTEEDITQLNAALSEDALAEEAVVRGSPRFAQTEVRDAAEDRLSRRRVGRGKAEAVSHAMIKAAKLGFADGDTSPAGLARFAGVNNASKMGRGFLKKLGHGIAKFAKKAGRWLKNRLFGHKKKHHNKPAPPARGRGRGWVGRMFNKVKAFGGRVAKKIGQVANKWGAQFNAANAANAARAARKAVRAQERAARRAAREKARADAAAAQAAAEAKRQAEYAAWAAQDVTAHRQYQESRAAAKKARAARKSKHSKLDYTGVEADRPDREERPHTAEEIEDCVTCRYVWLQVEMDIGDTTLEDNVYDSFSQNALEAQKQPIFYPGCQMMWDQIDDMIGDYMDGKTVNQICENSLMCRLANP